MAYDDTMNKAAYIHELIKAQGNRPDLKTGSLHFGVRKRGGSESERIALFYYHWKVKGARGIYNTRAAVSLVSENLDLAVYADCNPKDQPRRFLGRTIALMRMARILAPLGYDVLAVWGKGEDAPHMVIPGDVQIPKDWMPQEVAERLWKQQRRLEGTVGTERGKKRGKPKNITWVRGYTVPTSATVDTGWKPTAASCNVSGCSCCDEGGGVGG